MAGPVVVPDVTQPTTQSLTQSTLDFSRPTQRKRPGPKPTESFLAPIRRSAPAATIVNATNAANEAVLLRQIQALPTIAYDDDSDSDSNGPRPRRSRKSYPRELKLSIVQWATSTYITKKNGSKKLISRYEAAKRLKLDEITLKRWIENRHKIASQRRNSRRGVNNPKRGQEDALELRLYASFKAARALGRQIDRRWFIRHAKAIYREQYPERILTNNGKLEYLKFKFSNGWFQGFRRRFRISNRCRTKQGQKVPEDFRPKIQAWLQYNRRQTVIRKDGSSFQGLPRGPTVPVVGRFKLSEIANMDQTPLAFDFMGSRTYESKGEKTVFQKESRSGWDKRQCTLQVTVFADGKLYYLGLYKAN